MATASKPRSFFEKRTARFHVRGYSAAEMFDAGELLNGSIAKRMDRAQDINDQPAPALAMKYLRFKTKAHGRRPARSGIRDLFLTGRLRRSMDVLSASENKVKLGFTDEVADLRMTFNQKRSRQYGVSPGDQKTVLNFFGKLPVPLAIVSR